MILLKILQHDHFGGLGLSVSVLLSTFPSYSSFLSQSNDYFWINFNGWRIIFDDVDDGGGGWWWRLSSIGWEMGDGNLLLHFNHAKCTHIKSRMMLVTIFVVAVVFRIYHTLQVLQISSDCERLNPKTISTTHDMRAFFISSLICPMCNNIIYP